MAKQREEHEGQGKGRESFSRSNFFSPCRLFFPLHIFDGRISRSNKTNKTRTFFTIVGTPAQRKAGHEIRFLLAKKLGESINRRNLSQSNVAHKAKASNGDLSALNGPF